MRKRKSTFYHQNCSQLSYLVHKTHKKFVFIYLHTFTPSVRRMWCNISKRWSCPCA